MNPENYKVIDFGKCTESDCPNNEYKAGKLLDHFHGLMYKKGRLNEVETNRMKFYLNQLGYVGPLIIEYISSEELEKIKKRYASKMLNEKNS